MILTLTRTHSEVGPARNRPSSQRYERWVNAAGGIIRGLTPSLSLTRTLTRIIQGLSKPSDGDDVAKEVVQLKYMQRSNEEQMRKLYHLWRLTLSLTLG